MDELTKAVNWLASTGFNVIIVVAGNHDFAIQERPFEARQLLASKGIIYLQDEEVVIDGLKFYGSPWTPTFYQWAFMRDRGPEIREKWDKIPLDTNILVTHGPPHGILDKNMLGELQGCEELRTVIIDRLKGLRFHAFGHIHEGYGKWTDLSQKNGPIFVNASIVNEAYSPINKPIVIEL